MTRTFFIRLPPRVVQDTAVPAEHPTKSSIDKKLTTMLQTIQIHEWIFPNDARPPAAPAEDALIAAAAAAAAAAAFAPAPALAPAAAAAAPAASAANPSSEESDEGASSHS